MESRKRVALFADCTWPLGIGLEVSFSGPISVGYMKEYSESTKKETTGGKNR